MESFRISLSVWPLGPASLPSSQYTPTLVSGGNLASSLQFINGQALLSCAGLTKVERIEADCLFASKIGYLFEASH
jgi:hypothetical protein